MRVIVPSDGLERALWTWQPGNPSTGPGLAGPLFEFLPAPSVSCTSGPPDPEKPMKVVKGSDLSPDMQLIVAAYEDKIASLQREIRVFEVREEVETLKLRLEELGFSGYIGEDEY